MLRAVWWRHSPLWTGKSIWLSVWVYANLWWIPCVAPWSPICCPPRKGVRSSCSFALFEMIFVFWSGKIFAAIGVLQTLSPFASSTLYLIFYSLTLSSAPGLFNLISANLFGLAIILLLFVSFAFPFVYILLFMLISVFVSSFSVVWRKKTANPAHYEPVFNWFIVCSYSL